MSDSSSGIFEIRPKGHPAVRARTLNGIVHHCRGERLIRRGELSSGDQVIVKTRNSIYSLLSVGDGTFAVSGGWFDKNTGAPATISINGCTYGGSALLQDVLAGPGLFLEFGNRVSTTRIRDVQIVRRRSAFGSDSRPN